MNCLINDKDLADIFVNDERSLLLAKIWASAHPHYILNGHTFVNNNDNTDIVLIDDVMDKMKTESVGESTKNLERLSTEFRKIIGDTPESDEHVTNAPIQYMQYEDKYFEWKGKRPRFNATFIEYITDFMTKEQEKEFNHSPAEWIGIFSNLDSLPQDKRTKYIDLMKDISNHLGFNVVISPFQFLDDIMRKREDPNFELKTLSFHIVSDNIDKVQKESRKSFMDYVKTPLRKFMFKFLLDNLKYKFNINYKWVKNVPFKARLYNGIIEINQDTFSDEDPFHEYLHPIILTIQKNNPELYQQLINIPEVQALAAQLSRDTIYAQYPDEEALVRVLSQPFTRVSYGTLFKQFIQWLKNLFKKVFNKNIPIDIDMTIGNISNLLLDSNRYLLDTNYFKNFERYSKDTFTIFKEASEQNTLTPEQQAAITDLEQNNNVLLGATKKTLDSTYEFTLPDTTVLSFIRPTSLDKNSRLDDLDPNLALFGTFSHEIFGAFLEIVMTHKDMFTEEFINNPTDKKFETTLQKLIYDVKLVPNKKSNGSHYEYADDAPTSNAKTSNKTQAESGQYYDSNYDATTNYKSKLFSQAVINVMVDLLKKSTPDDAIRYNTVFGQLSDVKIKNLLITQINTLRHLLEEVNNQEKINGYTDKVTIDNIALFNELFIHNYNNNLTETLYGGTLDIVIIPPSGRKYIFDLKSRNEILFENTANRKSGYDMINQVNNFYGIQQSLYRELVANAVGNHPSEIISNIVMIPRVIKFSWKSSDVNKFKTWLIGLKSDDDWEFLINGQSEENLIKLMNSLFYTIDVTDTSKFPESSRKILNEYSADINAGLQDMKNKAKVADIIPKPTKIVYQDILDPKDKVRIVTSLYNKEGLDRVGVDIGNTHFSNSTIKHLLKFKEIIDTIMYQNNDALTIAKRINEPTAEDLSHIAYLTRNLQKYRTELIKIKQLISNTVNLLNANENPETVEKTILKDLGTDSFETYHEFIDGIEKFTNNSKSRERYKDIIDGLRNIESELRKAISNQRTVLNGITRERVIKQQELVTKQKEIEGYNTTHSMSALNGNLSKALDELYSIQIAIDRFDIIIKNMNNSIDNLRLEEKRVTAFLYTMKNNATYDSIKQDAKLTLDTVNRYIEIMEDKNIPAKLRASYYKFVKMSIKLYSEIGVHLDIDSEKFKEDPLLVDLINLQVSFEKLIPKVSESIKIIIADLFSEYEMDTDFAKVKAETEMLATDIAIIKQQHEKYKELFNDYTDEKQQELADRLLSNTNRINIQNEDLEKLHDESRKTNLAKIATDFDPKVESSLFSLATEMFLPGSRSDSVLIQAYAILENEINGNYANSYRIISDEIQIESAKFVHAYNNSATDNKIRLLGSGLPYDRFTAYDKLIARYDDPDFETLDKAIQYLTSKDNESHLFMYQIVFDTEDKDKVKNMNINQVAAFIRNNPQIRDKYKKIKTLSLIDRVRYDFMSMFEDYFHAIPQNGSALKKRGITKDNEIYGSILKLFEMKFHKDKDNMFAFDVRKAFFKDYLNFIKELIIIYSKLNESSDAYDSISSNLFSSNLFTWITNAENDDIDINALDTSKTYDKFIFDLISSVSTYTTFEDLETSLKENHYKEIREYYGNNYGNMFILSAVEKYNNYSKDEDGKKHKDIIDVERQVAKLLNGKIEQYKNLLNELLKTYKDKSNPTQYETNEKDRDEKIYVRNILSMLYFMDTPNNIIDEFVGNNQMYKDILSEIKKSPPINIKELHINNAMLESYIRSSPFIYTGIKEVVSKSNAPLTFEEEVQRDNNTFNSLQINTDNDDVHVIRQMLTVYNIGRILPYYMQQRYILDKRDKKAKVTLNNRGYFYSNENGTTKHFDPDWDEFETNSVLFNYYKYAKNTLSYLYSIIPSSKRNRTSKLDLPFLEDDSFITWLDKTLKDKKFSNVKDLIGTMQQQFLISISNSVQDDNVEPQLKIKPIRFNTKEEMRKTSHKANYQIDHLLQILAYEALLFRERIDKFPISELIVTLVDDNKGSPNLQTGVKFNHIVNNTGIVPIDIDKDTTSMLTEEDKEKINLYTIYLHKLEVEKEKLESIKTVLEEEIAEAEDKMLSYAERLEVSDKILQINQLTTKINMIQYDINKYKSSIEMINNQRKFNKEALVRIWINTARKVQLTYSLTGQFGNLMNGLIQTSLVASGTKEEHDAYIESFKILNDMMFGNKVILGTAYAGNILTSTVAGSLAGTLSIPMWMVLANTFVDKMKDNNWIKSKFNSNVRKAINMELNYNISFDIVEQARAGLPEVNYYKVNADGKIVKNEDEFIQLISPFGFVKRAEKLIVVQNMLIESLVTKVDIPNHGKLSWWELHDENGKIKPEYLPFITQSMILDWTRKLSNRLHKANGNYTSKAQAETTWYGKLLLVYAKWIPETMRNFIGGYTPKEKDIFSESAHEGILVSAYKEAIEQFHKLVHGKMIVDFEVEPKKIDTVYSDGNSLYERIIIYKDGNIIHNSQNKVDFVNEYNNRVDAFNKLSDEDQQNTETVIKDLKELVKKYNIKMFKQMSSDEKQGLFKRLKSIFVSFITPFDFGKSLKDKTITRNVGDRLHNLFDDDIERDGYDKVHHANMRRFFNFTHIIYSMFLTKTMLLIMFGYLTKVLDFDDDDDAVKNMKFIINRYNQLWKDVTYYSNPVSAFYKFFTGGLSTIKFAKDLAALNIDIIAALPHFVNALMGDSEIGDVILESMGMRDPILERSRGITNVRPVNDFIDMIPLLNKMSSIYKQTMNDYTSMD